MVKSEFFDPSQQLIDYFMDNWRGMLQTGRRRKAPKFATPLWNCHSSVMDGVPKTKNAVEGWHHTFSSLLSAHHPTTWKYIYGIEQEESLNELKVNQYLAGASPLISLRKYCDAATSIMKIVEEYGQIDHIEYLSSI